ncbi:hypothetical protein LJR219_002688 [Phenylobacterium sp. LjRoot219]|uniref:hypothetical protein n=1 Tax=Phenylobacterium sp. LjRoot219 TaxID=3342283 RepID=UPI003ECFF962
MLQRLRSIVSRRSPAFNGRRLSLGALRIAPWIVFGPITGVMSEAAIAAFRKRRPLLGWLVVLANVAILAGMPLLTAALLARQAG